MTALQLLTHLSEAGRSLPTIMMSSNSTVPMAVQAMRSGAIDFLSKPLHQAELLASLRRALEKSQEDSKISAGREDAASRIAGLTRRQSQIMKLILAGQPNKNIAVDLDISQRTVEHHRALIMEKTGTTSLPDLARLALAAIKSKT
jgi:two-component system CheB/CheR fusion protein